MTGLIILAIFIFLTLMSLPVAIALGVAGAIGLVLLDISSPIIIAQHMYGGLRHFPLAAIPLFLLMANLMEAGGISKSLVRFANSLVGRVRGSLAIGNVVASTFFAGISGSSLADVTAVGSIMIPSMIRQGYKPAFAGAVTAAANIVGPIIPPSILMILYGFAADQSVIKLFLGGVVPGLSLSLCFGFLAFWISHRRRYGVQSKGFHLREAFETFFYSLPALIIPVIIVVGIVGGVFTVTESAGAGAVYALLYNVVLISLKKEARLSGIFHAIRKTMLDTVVVLILLGASQLLGWVLTVSQLPQKVVGFMGDYGRVETLLMVNLILLISGMILEPAASVLLLTPLLIPVMQNLGVDLVHFGIIMVVNLQIGVLTPPVAGAAFVTSRIAKITFEEQIRALLPWIGLGLIILILVTYVPQFSMWLPNKIVGN